MPKVFVRNYLIFTAILLVCVGGLGYLLVSADKEISEADDSIFQTHKVIIEAEELNSLVSEMLSAQRAFMMSKNEDFLERYESAKADTSQSIATLTEMTQDNPSQQSRLFELRQYFTDFSKQIEERAELSRDANVQEILNNVGKIDNLQGNIRRIDRDFLNEEYKLLDERINIVKTKRDEYFWVLLVGGTVATILLMIFNGYLLRIQSKRTAAENMLSENEAVFRLAMEGTNDGVFDWNLKTNEAFYSKQFSQMLGYDPDEFEGSFSDFSDKIHPDEQEKVKEYMDLYLDGQLSEYSNTFRMRHKSGRYIWVNSRGKLIYDPKGKPVRMVGAHTDISASKEYELRLQQAKRHAEEANRAKTDFLAHMSHEIRTPLTTINGAAEILLQDKNKLDEKKQKLVSVLSASSITLKDLISDILDFSKIESGELELDEAAFDLAESFEHIVSVMAVRACEKDLDFLFDYDDVKDIRFYSDPIRLRQILINLIGNALKFTEAGHIHVKAYRDKHNDADILRVDVEDSGIGINEEQHELIFERFKQADASVSRKYGGTGLGLPISKNLASLMGGDIEITSELGKGSTFSLILPLRTIEGTEDEKKKNRIRKNKINEKLKSSVKDAKKILLVEDYEGNIVVISYILEDMEIDYDVATTGLQAVNLWKDNHYDVIIMDVQMPEMDGFTATAQIRRIEEEQSLEQTPIIGMTAHALIGDKDKCIEAGMNAYLPKPIDEMKLKAHILKFINEDDDEDEDVVDEIDEANQADQ